MDHDDPFYQIQNLPVFKMRCRTFEYSSERLDTGVTAIDNIETNESLDALQYQFVLETGTDSGTNYLLTEDGDFIVQEDYNVDTIDTSTIIHSLKRKVIRYLIFQRSTLLVR